MDIDITDRKVAEEAVERLASIVELSDDAIVAKNLHGIIQSWNSGATRLFGYLPEEVVGRSITISIPEDRLREEADIISRVSRGERVLPYDTIRKRRDGSLVDVSITVSPIRDAGGQVVGASKIARDISERKRAENQQKLFLRESHHRTKNLFALTFGIITVSARSATSVEHWPSRSGSASALSLAPTRSPCRASMSVGKRMSVRRRCLSCWIRSLFRTPIPSGLSALRSSAPKSK